MLLELLLLVFKHWFRFTLRCSHQRQPGKWGANKHNLVLWLKEEEENGRNNRLELLGKWGTTITISYYIRSRETWPQVILVMDTVRRRTTDKRNQTTHLHKLLFFFSSFSEDYTFYSFSVSAVLILKHPRHNLFSSSSLG